MLLNVVYQADEVISCNIDVQCVHKITVVLKAPSVCAAAV